MLQRFCIHYIAVNRCSDNPCGIHGQCTPNSDGSYNCKCEENYIAHGPDAGTCKGKLH